MPSGLWNLARAILDVDRMGANSRDYCFPAWAPMISLPDKRCGFRAKSAVDATEAPPALAGKRILKRYATEEEP